MCEMTEQGLTHAEELFALVRAENERGIEDRGLKTRTVAGWMIRASHIVSDLVQAIAACDCLERERIEVLWMAIRAATDILKIAEMYGWDEGKAEGLAVIVQHGQKVRELTEDNARLREENARLRATLGIGEEEHLGTWVAHAANSDTGAEMGV